MSRSEKMMDQHNAAVAAISKQAAHFHESAIPFKIYHGSTNSTRTQNFDPKKLIDTSKLTHILKIDKEAKTCLVEPNVPMDAIAYTAIKDGLLPPVVPEFPGITAGGAFSGTAGESSCFRHGLFDETVNWFEMVLPDGTVVKCSPEERADLFRGAAGAFGTLGVITLLELRLHPVGEFVELEFHLVHSADEVVKLQLEKTDDKTVWYIDAILFSSSMGVVVIGRDRAKQASGERVQHFTRAHDPWFYLYAQKQAKRLSKSKSQKPEPHKVLVPHVDYLFRYDRGGFWTGYSAFKLFRTPFNRITRFILDPLMRTRKMYEALHHSGFSHRFIIQDLLIPGENTAEFVRWSDVEIGIYPLWLCPIRAHSPAPLHTWPKAEGELLVNVGLWGAASNNIYKSRDKFLAHNKDIEEKVAELGGRKWLYAQVFRDETTFWEGFSEGEKGRYEALRRKYGAEFLPTLYQKVHVDEDGMWPKEAYTRLGPVKAVFKTILGSNHLLKKM